MYTIVPWCFLPLSIWRHFLVLPIQNCRRRIVDMHDKLDLSSYKFHTCCRMQMHSLSVSTIMQYIVITVVLCLLITYSMFSHAFISSWSYLAKLRTFIVLLKITTLIKLLQNMELFSSIYKRNISLIHVLKSRTRIIGITFIFCLQNGQVNLSLCGKS